MFTVNLRHHRDDQAFSDCVGFIRGLDKHNTPRLGDVMVPPPQINQVSWFDRKPQAAADEPLYRFYKGTRAAAAVPSSNVELWAFSSMGRRGGVRGGDGGLAGLRLQGVVVGLFLRLWTSLRPCRLSSSSLRCTRGWCLRSSSSTECFNLLFYGGVYSQCKLCITVEIPQVLFLVLMCRCYTTAGAGSLQC